MAFMTEGVVSQRSVVVDVAWHSMHVWHPICVDSCTKLAALDSIRCGRGHRALCPGATPLCCNHSLVRRHGPLEAAEAIYNQEAPQLARITSWA